MLALVGFKEDGTIGHISLHTFGKVLYRYVAESVSLELFGVYGDNIFVYEGLGDYAYHNGRYPTKPLGVFTVSRFTPKPPIPFGEWFDAERERQVIERAHKLQSGEYGECLWCAELVKIGNSDSDDLVCAECEYGREGYTRD